MNREDILLTIRELSDRSGISIRTIRYYTTEGLLPPPEARGRYALYTDEHLIRLTLITRLKNAYFPLQSIRTQLQSLSVAEMQSLLLDPEEVKIAPRLETTATGESTTQTLEMLISVLKARDSQPSSALRIDAETWQRLRLQEGVEIHLLLPLNEEQMRLLSLLREAMTQV